MPPMDSIDSTPMARAAISVRSIGPRPSSNDSRCLFCAGLEDQETCLWMLPPSLTQAEALVSAGTRDSQISSALRFKQFQLIYCQDWRTPISRERLDQH